MKLWPFLNHYDKSDSLLHKFNSINLGDIYWQQWLLHSQMKPRKCYTPFMCIIRLRNICFNNESYDLAMQLFYHLFFVFHIIKWSAWVWNKWKWVWDVIDSKWHTGQGRCSIKSNEAVHVTDVFFSSVSLVYLTFSCVLGAQEMCTYSTQVFLFRNKKLSTVDGLKTASLFRDNFPSFWEHKRSWYHQKRE